MKLQSLIKYSYIHRVFMLSEQHNLKCVTILETVNNSMFWLYIHFQGVVHKLLINERTQSSSQDILLLKQWHISFHVIITHTYKLANLPLFS